MPDKPTYEELEQIVRNLEKTDSRRDDAMTSLRDSVAFYRDIFEKNNAVKMLIDPKSGDILDANAAACQFYQHQPAEMRKLKIWDINILGEAETRKYMALVLAGKQNDFLFQHRLGSGEIRDVQVYSGTLQAGDNTILHSIVMDVTARQRMEKALKASEKKYRDLVDSMTDWVWSMDADGVHHFTNKAVETLLGCQVEEVVNSSIYPLIHPDSIPAAKAALEKGIQHKTGWRCLEIKWLHKDGSIRYFESTANPIFDEKGFIIGFSGVDRDITERKKIEKALKEYKLFLDNINDIAYMTDSEGNLTYINPAVEEITGLSPDELIGQTFAPLIIEEERPSLMDVFHRTLTGERLENTFTFTSGVTCHFTSLPFRDDHGRIIGAFGIARNMIERLTYEKALKDSEARLNKAQAVANIGAWEYEIATGQTWASEQAFLIYGIERTSPYLPWEQLEAAIPDAQRVNQALADLIEKNRKFDIEFEVRRIKDNRVVLVHSVADLIHEKGVPVKVLGTIHDITERRKIETELRTAQKIESIGTMASGIAHDFNNILFPIMGMSEILMDDFDSNTREYQSANEIFKASMRGRDLVQQILAFSRRSENKMIPVHLQQLLKEVMKLSRSTIPSNIKIVHEIEPHGGMVMADPTQIHQIAMNLITNAFHAIEPNNGTIRVVLRKTGSGEADFDENVLEPGQYVHLQISDDGCGIPTECIDKIFEPYFTTKKKGKGTGLGLAVVYGIVKAHRGEIRVRSKMGEGTSVDLFLPLIEKTSPGDRLQKTYQNPTGDETILLVDDEAAVISIEKQMLERLGYHVIAQTSSLDALQAFGDSPDRFDLVITDMAMPNMTGDRLAQELFAIRPDIPVIICTGFSEKINKPKAKAAGINGFLMKPVIMSKMAEVVRRVLDAGDSECKC